MKNILIIANSLHGLYNFRKELLAELKKRGYDIFISAPSSDMVGYFSNEGYNVIHTNVRSRGINPFKDILLLKNYLKIIRHIDPLVVLSFTIKPNLYGGLACRFYNKYQIANITGLGTAVENKGFMQKITFILYKYCLKKTHLIFFQNQGNINFCISNKLITSKYKLIPGSGVNLKKFNFSPYPNDNILKFIFISRIMKQKGIDEYINIARVLKTEGLNVEFHVLGACSDEYLKTIHDLHNKGIIIYHGRTNDVIPYLQQIHCTIHPTFYPEGMSNVLLESCAIGRPIITTNRSGCKEIVEDGINGYVVRQQDTEDLLEKVRKFISLPYVEKINMGLNARAKVEKEFNRDIVINAYLSEIQFIDN